MTTTELLHRGRRLIAQTYANREGLDFRALALFRIALGLTLLANLFTRCYGGKFFAHYTEGGLMPLAALTADGRWSLLDAFSQGPAAKVGFTLIALVYVAFTIGWQTKVMRTLVPLILLSLYHRNPLIDDGSDWTLRFFSLWMQFFPLAERWSVDAVYLKRPVTARTTLRSAAALAFILNLSFSYFLNAWQKDSPAWLDGTAVRLVLWDPWTSSAAAAWLRGWVPDFLVTTMTYGSKVGEYAAFLIIPLAYFFRRPKLATVALLLVLHASFGINIHLGTFVLNYFAVALLFIPSRFLDRLESRWNLTYNYSALPSRPAVIFANIALLLFCLQQGRLLVLNNPFFSDTTKNALNQVSPKWVVNVDKFLMVTQEWFMFRFPGAVPLMTVEIVMADGRRLDPFREGNFSATRPAEQSQHVGKYWVTFLWRLRGELNGGTRDRLTQYFFDRGAREVNFYATTIIPPRTAAESVHIEPPVQLLSVKKKDEWNFAAHDLVSENSRRDLASEQNMQAYEDKWKKNDQLFLNFHQPKERADLNFESTIGCLADVTLVATGAPDFGIIEVEVNHELAGQHDEYVADGVTRLNFPLGKFTIEKGANRLSVLSVGKNKKSHGTKAGVDLIRWVCR